jgi:hypothetical protein
MAGPPPRIGGQIEVTFTVDTSRFAAAFEDLAAATRRPEEAFERLHRRWRAARIADRIVRDVLAERALAGGPVGRAALAELAERDPHTATKIAADRAVARQMLRGSIA